MDRMLPTGFRPLRAQNRWNLLVALLILAYCWRQQSLPHLLLYLETSTETCMTAYLEYLRQIGADANVLAEIRRHVELVLENARSENRQVRVWTRSDIPRGQFDEKGKENPNDYHVLIGELGEGITISVYQPPGGSLDEALRGRDLQSAK